MDTTTPTLADAQYVHDEWDRRTRAHDITGLLDLYTTDAILESPLVPRIMDTTCGVLVGQRQLREFFERGTRGRPNELVRFYRTGQFLFQHARLVWEYPRQTPDGDQVDITEVMDLIGPRIRHHRIYWGWFGTPLLEPHQRQ
jgi:ketosteroid isomerase-like protein